MARRSRKYSEADEIRDELAENGVELFDKVNEWASTDGTLRGVQSLDYENYEVAKDRERYDRGYNDQQGGAGGRGGGGGGDRRGIGEGGGGGAGEWGGGWSR